MLGRVNIYRNLFCRYNIDEKLIPRAERGIFFMQKYFK
nr:MAG TPA: hypothetical protein [Caudoviricetes sp.]